MAGSCLFGEVQDLSYLDGMKFPVGLVERFRKIMMVKFDEDGKEREGFKRWEAGKGS